MTFKSPPIVHAEDLIGAREARGLAWSLSARSIFVGIFAVMGVLHLLRMIGPGIAAESDRITNLVASLKDFTHLDEAELQFADVRDGLRSTLAGIEPDKTGKAKILTDLGEVPEILCRPKQLNQVFMTLIVNALEALKCQGTLRVSTATGEVDGNLSITIERHRGTLSVQSVVGKGTTFTIGLPIDEKA